MNLKIRLWRSPYSDFGKSLKRHNDLQDETVTAVNAYTDEVLAAIAKQGFNAIWVHGLLQDMVSSSVFPEFGKNRKLHTQNMRRLISRAARHGIKVFIYMQPPRGINAKSAFWKNHNDVAGTAVPFVSDDGYKVVMRALCTSTQKVKQFIRQSAKKLIQELPGLGGVILITASEYVSHCYSRYNYAEFAVKSGHKSSGAEESSVGCPRCCKRHPTEIVNEIIHLVHNGIRAVSKDIAIIAWNWSWNMYEKDPSPTIIKNLPGDVILMCDFERGGKKTILGKERTMDEYSLSYIGPSKRFLASYKTAKKRGLKVMAKLQLGTTHEIATAANIPLIVNLYEKASNMRKLGIADSMGCWNFGNMLTANTAAFNAFMNARKLLPGKQALLCFASDYFPGCRAEFVIKAWSQFCLAMDSYPFSVPFLYFSPINYSLAYPLKPGKISKQPTGRSWQMDKRGDNLEDSIDIEYTLNEIIICLGRLMRQWKRGVNLLSRGLGDSRSNHAQQEQDNAWICYHIFRSTWNTYRVYRLRKKWTDNKIPAYAGILKNELSNLEKAFPIAEKDRRFGFHSEAQAYMFDPAGIKTKINSLKAQIKKFTEG